MGRRHRVDGVGRIEREVGGRRVLAVSDAWCGADVGRAWVPIRLGADSRDRSQVSYRATDAGTGRFGERDRFSCGGIPAVDRHR